MSTINWEVEYYHRGDVSSYTKFYGPGAYEFLWTPDYTTVYLQVNGNWTFQGMYLEPALGYPVAPLPEGFPSIIIPSWADAATVVQVPEPGGDFLLIGAFIVGALWHWWRHKREQSS